MNQLSPREKSDIMYLILDTIYRHPDGICTRGISKIIERNYEDVREILDILRSLMLVNELFNDEKQPSEDEWFLTHQGEFEFLKMVRSSL